MNSGDFISINYVGRIKDTGEIFDLTREDVAKKENISDEKIKYRPITIIIDGDFAIRGLNNVLKEMKVGEKRNIKIEPKDAFGERNANLVRLIPISNFKNQNIDPIPGSYVTINGMRGRITSASGGRILVDFNHPLSGKRLEYEIEIVSEVKDMIERIKAIVYYFSGVENEKTDAKVESDNVEIMIKESDLNKNVKKIIADNVLKWIGGMKTVKFIDVFEKT